MNRSCTEVSTVPFEKDITAEERGKWFKEAKYAMFIHWGTYSVLGGKWKGKTYYGISEWIQNQAQIPVAEYEKVAQRFNPVDFNADAWAQLAKDAGMRYIVITAKHHEGFAMFKSQASPYNIVDATPFKRDPLKELAEACRRKGIKLGFYYSQYQDWHEPDAAGNLWDFKAAGDFQKYLDEKAIPQIKELLENYGPVAMIWFDTPGDISKEDAQKLVDLVRQLQPRCLINGRIGHDLGDYQTLGDQEIPTKGGEGLWEAVDTHNDTWAYAWYDHNWKSPKKVIERLTKVISRGGNYALNVGPDGRGKIPAAAAEILHEVGEWVSRNSDGIYGTSASPIGTQAWGECTYRPGRLYLHVFDWPANGKLIVPGLKNTIEKAYLLADKSQKPLDHQTIQHAAVIKVPVIAPDPLVTVVVLEMTGVVKMEKGVFVLNGFKNDFEAVFADVKNCSIDKLSWMEKFGEWYHVDCIRDWKGADNSAQWHFRALEKGTFYAEVTYSCPKAANSSEWQICLADFNTHFPMIASGEFEESWHAANEAWQKVCQDPLKIKAELDIIPRFRTYRIGLLEIPDAGDYTLSICCLTENGRNVNVEKISLIPML